MERARKHDASRDGAVIVWFRRDLRLADNPALLAAIRSGRPLIPAFILDDETPGRWRLGGAARWWLHRSLASLHDSLAAAGSRLILRRGRAVEVVVDLVRAAGVVAVYCNRCHEPHAVKDEEMLVRTFAGSGIELHRCNGTLLRLPQELRSGRGGPFCVFGAFWRALRARGDPPSPLRAPSRLPPAPAVESEQLAAWELLPQRPNWAKEFAADWTPGERGASRALEAFLDGAAHAYAADRDRPDREGTSRLSPHLQFGEISPRQIWHAVRSAAAAGRLSHGDADRFLTELGWREFAHHLLAAHPSLPEQPLRRQFASFRWRRDRDALSAWQRGLTGYPIVDAGMRELWRRGWMHNRVRMIAASFLVKHLLIDWRDGEAWFWDTLLDADLANNAMNWQWVAGCGTDAVPYFRIFNPVLQGERFDPEGAYVRRWVPELARLPAAFIHKPWLAPDAALAQAGVVLGKTYPYPIIDHADARERALAAFREMKSAGRA
ncbi:MAG: deoxyribodipyrimidine photo-lyase [Pseudolabrys sp.]|nr:deoxyribodipyrimidine photo-lyase [Pseudolabrys sp.]